MSIVTLAVSSFPFGFGASTRAVGEEGETLKQIEDRVEQAEQGLPIPEAFVSLPRSAAHVLLRMGWTKPCRAAFDLLARSYAEALAEWITSGRLEPADLTFAAEALGRSPKGWVVRPALLRLVRDPVAIVREGAIYGLQRHLNDDVRRALATIVQEDSSPGVRLAASDALADGSPDEQ